MFYIDTGFKCLKEYTLSLNLRYINVLLSYHDSERLTNFTATIMIELNIYWYKELEN